MKIIAAIMAQKPIMPKTMKNVSLIVYPSEEEEPASGNAHDDHFLPCSVRTRILRG
jgi:hypothetical protein